MLDIIKIKETFPSISVVKIDQINDIVKESSKPKLHIQMTTKGPSRKQVIIPMSNENNVKFIKNSSIHVTNKVSLPSNLLIIENYVKYSENIDSSQVDSPRLPQSKFYLKIIGIPYFPYSNMQDRLISSNVELVIKQNHIFNNVSLVSKLRVIKVSLKSDIVIIWINIWNI